MADGVTLTRQGAVAVLTIERPEALRAQRQKYLRLSRQYSIDRSVEQLERAYRQLAGAAAPVG